MLIKKLHPNQILTLSDYPVHSEQVLKLYHRMFWRGHHTLIPPLPVIAIDKGQLKMTGNGKKTKRYNELLTRFLKNHPRARYCLVDGSHKTTAAALCNKSIRAMVFKTDADILAARKMVEQGELLSLTTGDTNSIKDALKILRQHFFKARRFETVAEKTARMVRGKVVPRYMIEVYRKAVPKN